MNQDEIFQTVYKFIEEEKEWTDNDEPLYINEVKQNTIKRIKLFELKLKGGKDVKENKNKTRRHRNGH